MASLFNRRVVIWLLPALLCAVVFASVPMVAADEAKPVIELFTSQGCSSCPPADALLGKFSKRKDVIALSLPVDYWDYLGWKDTLASPAFSARQRAYARILRNGQIYTPQAVVNGLQYVNGSSRSAIEMAIEATEAALRNRRVLLDMSVSGDTIVIAAGAAPPGLKHPSGTLWLAHIKNSETVSIKRGENRGKTLTYYNVVRELMPIGKWSGEPVTLKLPKQHLKGSHKADGCAVLLQQNDAGPIIAAYQLRDW